jgi:hypothetical protein
LTKTRSTNHALLSTGVTCLRDSLTLLIRSSKTVKPNQQEQVVHVASQPRACPILAATAYICTKPQSQFFLVHGDASQVTYDEFSNTFKKAAEIAGLPTKNLTTHSFRIGGTTFYHSQGWDDAHLKNQGRWSTQAFKKYIRMPKQDSL